MKLLKNLQAFRAKTDWSSHIQTTGLKSPEFPHFYVGVTSFESMVWYPEESEHKGLVQNPALFNLR